MKFLTLHNNKQPVAVNIAMVTHIRPNTADAESGSSILHLNGKTLQVSESVDTILEMVSGKSAEPAKKPRKKKVANAERSSSKEG